MDSKSGFGFQGGYRLPGETARWVASLLAGGFFPVSGSERSRHRWGTAGFTLIELLNVIAIIGILSGLGINTFSGYKVRAYDAHSKQALRDMHFFCNAFWIDEYPSKECDLPTIKDPIYGFNQNPNVAANLPPSPYDTFCATAKHSESPNTFTINNKSVISLGPSCGGSADAILTAYVCSGSFNDPCPTSACDEECTKQKATDRLLAVLDALPDLMQPTPEEIANAIQGIENRAYTDDPGETPTLHAEGMVDELVAAAEPPPEEPPAPTKAEQTEEKFEDNCAVIRETAKQCGSQTTPISHVDDEGRTWSMNCPVKDAHEARAYYYRLLSENAVYGGAGSNSYYQKEDGPGHQPHNKTCCYGLHDGFQPENPRYGFQASTRENFSKEKYSGTCGLQPTAGKSGSLSMLCNMGQTGGETQFRSCDVNVMPPPPPPPQTFESYKPPASAPGSFATHNTIKAIEECNSVYEGTRTRDEMGAYGVFAFVYPNGDTMPLDAPNSSRTSGYSHDLLIKGDCASADNLTYGDGKQLVKWVKDTIEGGKKKIVFVGEYSEWWGPENNAKRGDLKYNFETGMWVNNRGERYKNGKLVE